MPLLRQVFGRTERSRSMPAIDGRGTAAGVSVTPERALQISAVYSCVRRLAESTSGLPVGIYSREGGYRRPVSDHPVLPLLADAPNPTIDSAEFWRTIVAWKGLRGNGYAYVERAGSGMPIGLWPIAPTSVEIRRDKRGLLVYKVTLDSTEYAPIREKDGLVRAENMLHFRAFGMGIEGLSPVGMARQSVGISFAAQQYVGGFFARDASPGGVISVEGNLTDGQYDRLSQQWQDLHEGFSRSHRLAVLEGGAKWESVSLSPDDAKFLEVMKFSDGQIASMYGVPPHMIGNLDRATFSNIEHQSIEYVVHGLSPWLVRCERVSRRLLGPGLYVKFNVNGLLRGDIAARYQAYTQGRQWGWLSANDVRRKEDEEPIDGGDDYLVPLNMVPAGASPVQRTREQIRLRGRANRDVGDDAPAVEHPEWVERTEDLLGAFFDEQRAAVVAAVAQERSVRAIGDLVDRAEWDEALASLLTGPAVSLADELASAAAEQLGGTYTASWALAYLQAASARQARNINITTWSQIEAALRAVDEDSDDGPSTPVEAVDQVFDEATQSRAGLVAAGFVTAIGSFARTEGATQAGARTKTWRVTSANPRSTHAAMDGETVPVADRFSNGAKWPHDPDAGVDETAGCSCTVEFSTEE